MRTGGGAALTFGQAVTGVPPTTLLAQRRAAAVACAPAAGPSGQDIDLALALADGRANGRADPAHEAHLLPIGLWAEAVWHSWLPRPSLHKIIEVRGVALATARSLWRHVRGPGSAMIASAWRLGWTVADATHLCTDEGRELVLTLDPPVVVRAEVMASVRRWRDRLVFSKYKHLGQFDESHGLHLKPLWKALRPSHVPSWNEAHQAGLRSAFADRQWPQDRCWTAGWTQHDRCMLCVEAARVRRCAACPSPPQDSSPAVPTVSEGRGPADVPACSAPPPPHRIVPNFPRFLIIGSMMLPTP